MARIRSVKPEYWLDRKLAKGVSRDARLLYIGLWNYADEHGRLHGDPAVIKGQVFPYDDDIGLESIDDLLAELAHLGRVQLYDFDGDPYIFLPKLDKHQRLEPAKAKSRLPEPPEPPPLPPTPHPPSSRAHSEKTVAECAPIEVESEPIVVQQVAGSRLQVAGSREQVAGGVVAPRADRSAQTLVAEWIDHCDSRPPSRVIGPVSKYLREMLEEGQHYEKVRNGLALWHEKRLHPSSLPSCVFEASQGRKLNKAEQRTANGLAVVRSLQEQEARQQGEIA